MTDLVDFSELLERLTPDAVRNDLPFSSDFNAAHSALLAASDQSARESVLAAWLRRHQPCLFGRVAAKEGLIAYCFLTEDDLRMGAQHVRDTIQVARLQWTRAAYEGRRSGFVVCVLSDRLARSTPDSTVMSIASLVASLYLLTTVNPDEVYLEDIFLELPSFARTTWRWSAGVNYFAANADGRWWQDHRMPGGIAFSVNSVGHLVKSGAIGRAQKAIADSLGIVGDQWLPTKVDSLDEALEFAMRTIDLASDATSGRATRLIEAEIGERCPVKLPANLAGKSCSNYAGFYHTDFTLPSEYFRPDVARPPEVRERKLDFTYLSDPSLGNPDHILMGSGRQIRSAAGGQSRRPAQKPRSRDENPRSARAQPVTRPINECARLLAALRDG